MKLRLKFYFGLDEAQPIRGCKPVTKVWNSDAILHGIGRKKQPPEAKVIGNQQGKWGYLIAWEFRPKPGHESRFETVYGRDGIWAKFFMQGEGFIGTELNRDLKDRRRYLTLDLWVSKEAYDKFQAVHLAEYRAIDAQCEELTEQETELGRFERLG